MAVELAAMLEDEGVMVELVVVFDAPIRIDDAELLAHIHAELRHRVYGVACKDRRQRHPRKPAQPRPHVVLPGALHAVRERLKTTVAVAAAATAVAAGLPATHGHPNAPRTAAATAAPPPRVPPSWAGSGR